MNKDLNHAFMPVPATVVERVEEGPDLFTLRLELAAAEARRAYHFEPGQFNMLYLHGVGEVPISIASDPQDKHLLDHTIRTVGRVTRGLARLRSGDQIGIRGPYGHGWPMREAEGRDLLIITGGLGCAPAVSVIRYVQRRRKRFGHLNIVQGVKHSADLIWKERWQQWSAMPDTRVLLTADKGDPLWPWHIGPVTGLFGHLQFHTDNVTAMMCGPEGMMKAAARQMLDLGIKRSRIWLSMERNMQCALGKCGHCQFGPTFICKDGPVFRYDRVESLLQVKGV
ncbi:MAG: FAD/NAD(P)-binding protein [gamma proteobacterium symbiont of Bathyaustriella thionipta]|nr:FAD/NAD(P)-binding protein [gamma proteobacterium symbiont of Bathyaustriella thionipta]